MTDPLRIGFAGMTHLAICSAYAAAEKGFSCVGFDPDRSVIEALRERRFPIFEPGLEDISARNSERLMLTDKVQDLAALDVCFVAPDVPTDSGGRSDLGAIQRLIETVDSNLAPEATMVVLSQVPPGFTRALRRRPDRRFCQVETLIFGQAIERALKPERIMVGCADPDRSLPAPYAAFLAAFGCPVLPMRYESAELAKIAINMFLVSSVSTTNTIAELCERIGADWQEIVPALRLDRRIGPHAYLTPGLGIGGGNLERDLVTFSELAARNSTDAGMIDAWRRNSERRRRWALDCVLDELSRMGPAPVIGVLGLAYKEGTASTRNSAALGVIVGLPDSCRVRAYDPVVGIDPAWRRSLTAAQGVEETCAGADAVLVMTPWSEFRSLDAQALAASMKGKLVVDPYGLIDGRAAATAGLRHRRLGQGRSNRADAG